jgi:RNA polymerase sigma-70 factor (ECF subfamily)
MPGTIVCMTTGNEPHEVKDLDQRIVAEMPVLRAFLRKLAPAEEEDLLQDVLERALRYRHAFHAQGSLRGWLMKTAYRTFVDHHRKRTRTPARLLDQAEMIPDRTDQGPDHREELNHLLERLSPMEREVLVRFHAGGESLAEISAALQLPVNTVKSHLHRARQKFSGLGS